MTWTIYALTEPVPLVDAGEVRYVGVTSQTPRERLRRHRIEALDARVTNHKAHWLRPLLAAGLDPSHVVLETGEDVTLWPDAERRWIAHYRAAGARLTNIAPGGRGTLGVSRPSTRVKDLTGQTFNQLTVLRREGSKRGASAWRCRCACPQRTEILAKAADLTRGRVKSCGCLRREAGAIRAKDESGQIFGRLTVIRREGSQRPAPGKPWRAMWRCRCSCSGRRELIVAGQDLERGSVKSCGCLARQNGRDRVKDRAGQVFGRLLVLRREGSRRGSATWRCRCSCSKRTEIVVLAYCLVRGTTRSCGCLLRESAAEMLRRQRARHP